MIHMSERTGERRIDDVIKIGKFTSSVRAGGAIAHNVRRIVGMDDELGTLKLSHFDKVGSGRLFEVQASGTDAIYSALKALTFANAYLQGANVKVGIAPGIETLSDDVTGMIFEVSLHKVTRK
jgi:stage V sporulation protein SpoVS